MLYFDIRLDDRKIKLCMKCYNQVCNRAGVKTLMMYKGREIVISPAVECDLHNKKNETKI